MSGYLRGLWRRCCAYFGRNGEETREGGGSADSIGEPPDVPSPIDGLRLPDEATSFDSDLIKSAEMGKGESMQQVVNKPKMTAAKRNRIVYGLEEGKREEAKKSTKKRSRTPAGIGEGGSLAAQSIEEDEEEDGEIIINKVDNEV